MLKPRFILVVEDNDDDYELVELACRRAEISFPRLRMKDGLEAQEFLAGQVASSLNFSVPALVLADLKMPRMTGMELLSWVRAEPQFKRLPFVFLTSSAHVSDINEAYERFANSYLVKPMDLKQLTDLLRQVKLYWLDLNRHPELPLTPSSASASKSAASSGA